MSHHKQADVQEHGILVETKDDPSVSVSNTVLSKVSAKQ